MIRRWEGSGTSYRIEWGGAPWQLLLDAPQPGLIGPGLGPVLALEGLARPGRWDRQALSGSSLIQSHVHYNGVEAIYRPDGWGETTVTATWRPRDEEGMDLQVEIQARSVGELQAVEVKLLSALEPLPPLGSHRSVEPRDAASAALSYDGREDDLARLVTGPPGEPRGPWFVPRKGIPGRTYVEIAHPEDASRRISEGRLPFGACRVALFGHDLERGVALRGRVRAFWCPDASAFEDAERHLHEFLAEPPPLSH